MRRRPPDPADIDVEHRARQSLVERFNAARAARCGEPEMARSMMRRAYLLERAVPDDILRDMYQRAGRLNLLEMDR